MIQGGYLVTKERRPFSRSGWAGLLSLGSDPDRSNVGDGLVCRPPLHPRSLCFFRALGSSGLSATHPAACSPHMAFVMCSHPAFSLFCLQTPEGTANPMAPVLRGPETSGGGRVSFHASRVHFSRSHNDSNLC